MKISSARALYESSSVEYREVIPWGDLPEDVRRYWENFYHRMRETAKKEKLDAYED